MSPSRSPLSLTPLTKTPVSPRSLEEAAASMMGSRRGGYRRMVRRSDNLNGINDEHSENYVGKSTVGISVLNLMNNVIGAGILTLPFAVRQGSIFPTFLMMCVVCAFSIYSLILLGRCCELTQRYSYREIWSEAFSPSSGVLVQWIILVYTFGSCVSFVTLIGDFGPQIFAGFLKRSLLTDRVIDISLVSLSVLLPLSLSASLHSLRYSSFVSFGGLVYTVFLVITKTAPGGLEPSASGEDIPRGQEIKLFVLSSKIFSAVGLMNVSFTAHYNGPKYYKELAGRSEDRFRLVVCSAFGMCLAAYVVTAVSGYVHFGEFTCGDILSNYPTRRGCTAGSIRDDSGGHLYLSHGLQRASLIVSQAFLQPARAGRGLSGG
eukprot:884193_1